MRVGRQSDHDQVRTPARVSKLTHFAQRQDKERQFEAQKFAFSQQIENQKLNVELTDLGHRKPPPPLPR
jgi:hypothetical protein